MASADFGNRKVSPVGCQVAPSSALRQAQEAAAGDQTVDVRVQDEPQRPRLHHGQHADRTADQARLAGQVDDRPGGGFHQRAVAVELMPAQGAAQFFGHGDSDVEIGNR